MQTHSDPNPVDLKKVDPDPEQAAPTAGQHHNMLSTCRQKINDKWSMINNVSYMMFDE